MKSGPCCDIVIPIWNQRERTHRCLESILRSTPEPIRLILVDNGSEPPTREYLEKFRAAAIVEVRLIRNEANQGFIKAVNQGIRSGDAPWVCVLNNDTIVTAGWLAEMLKVAESDSRIGLVNPTSNSLGFHSGGIPLESYAADFRVFSGKHTELSTALGFCLLARRSLLEKVGAFDEAFGMGYFEDDDLSCRVKAAGFRCVRACAAYVYHEERVSFRLLPQRSSAFLENRRLFEKRWGRRLRILWAIGNRPPRGDPFPTEAALRLVGQGHWVTFVIPRSDMPMEVSSHAQVSRLPTRGVPWQAAAAVWLVVRRKKPFHVVISDDAGWLRCLKSLRWFHRAELVPAASAEEMIERYRMMDK